MWTLIGIIVIVIVFLGKDHRQKYLLMHTICTPLAVAWFGVKFAGLLFDIMPTIDTTNSIIISMILIAYIVVCFYYYVVWIAKLWGSDTTNEKSH
jgi:hypothetical protein